MSYITCAQYRQYTGDTETPENEITPLLQLASEVVNQVCLWRIGDDLQRFDRSIQEAIMKATAVDAQYLYENGGVDAAINGVTPYGGNIRIGDFSYGDQRITGRDAPHIRDTRVNQGVLSLLVPTGLLYAGMGG